jgi:hypothetical protein
MSGGFLRLPFLRNVLYPMSYLSSPPNTLPVDLFTRCICLQAGHVTVS